MNQKKRHMEKQSIKSLHKKFVKIIKLRYFFAFLSILLLIIEFIIKMSTVGLSQTPTNATRQSFSQQKYLKSSTREYTRQKNLQKQVNLLSEGLKIRDSQIATLKNIIASLKPQGKPHRTAITTQSDYDPIDFSDIRLSSFPLTSTIDSYREQLQMMNQKYSESCNVISQLQAKLRISLSNFKNREEELKNQVETLREDLKYLKQQHGRNLDCMNIQMQHRQTERLKIVQNKHKQQLEILNEQLRTLRQDNSEKLLQITRLNDKIKKQRANNDGNVKFIENQNADLRGKLQKISIELKEEFRRREQGLIAQFQVDLQLLHKQQAGQIKILCDRVRILKFLLEEKETQLKQLWKARSTQAQILFTTKCESIRPKQRNSEDLQLSTIDKYLKQPNLA